MFERSSIIHIKEKHSFPHKSFTIYFFTILFTSCCNVPYMGFLQGLYLYHCCYCCLCCSLVVSLYCNLYNAREIPVLFSLFITFFFIFICGGVHFHSVAFLPASFKFISLMFYRIVFGALKFRSKMLRVNFIIQKYVYWLSTTLM